MANHHGVTFEHLTEVYGERSGVLDFNYLRDMFGGLVRRIWC
jgi:hypothetical protein